MPQHRFVLWIVGAILLVTACSSHARRPEVTMSAYAFPDMGPAFPLALHDAVTGQQVQTSLRGKVVLLSFVASTCRETCPLIEEKFVGVQRALAQSGSLGSRVQLVIVGVDPIKDTRRALARMAGYSHAATGAFHFAYGSDSDVQQVLKAYGITVIFKAASHEDPDHTVAIYLIDRHGRIRYNFALAYPPATIARFANLLADEQS